MPIMPFQINEYLTKKLVQDLAIECSNASQVVIQQGAVGADDGSDVLVVPSAITLDITTAGLNGLDTGSEAANTWYYIWLIKDPLTGTVAGLLSASPTSPTLPAGYTKKRVVGAVRNDNSSDFYRFLQRDKEVQYMSSKLLVNGSATSYTSLTLSSFIPPSMACRVYYDSYKAHMSTGGVAADLSLDGVNSIIHMDAEAGGANSNEATQFFELINKNNIIYYKVSSGCSLLLRIIGFCL